MKRLVVAACVWLASATRADPMFQLCWGTACTSTEPRSPTPTPSPVAGPAVEALTSGFAPAVAIGIAEAGRQHIQNLAGQRVGLEALTQQHRAALAAIPALSPAVPTTGVLIERYVRTRVEILLSSREPDCSINLGVAKTWLSGRQPEGIPGPWPIQQVPGILFGEGEVLTAEMLAAGVSTAALGGTQTITGALREERLSRAHFRGAIDLRSPPTLTGALAMAEAISLWSAKTFTGGQVLAEFVEQHGGADDFFVIAYFTDGVLTRVRAGRRGEHPDFHADFTHVHVNFVNARPHVTEQEPAQ